MEGGYCWYQCRLHGLSCDTGVEGCLENRGYDSVVDLVAD